MQILRRIDVFPKFDSQFEREARDRTLFGGLLSFVSLVCVSLLVFSELRFFFTTQKHHEIFVDGNSVSEPLSEKQRDAIANPPSFFASKSDVNHLRIRLNITFFEVPCDLMSVDAIDSFGDYVPGMERSTTKRAANRATGKLAEQHSEHLSSVGVGTKTNNIENSNKASEAAEFEQANKKNEKRPGCWSCYGAELTPDACCNTCEEVRAAYSRKGWSFSPSDMSITQCAAERLRRALALKQHEGCNIVVDTVVSRVQGNLHLIPGRAFSHLGQHLHDLGGEEIKTLNLTHQVHELSFGEPFPGMKSPLDGAIGRSADHVDAPDNYGQQQQQQQQSAGGEQQQQQQQQQQQAQGQAPDAPHPWGGGKFSYYIKVVPTQYVHVSGYQIDTNEYAVTSHYAAGTAGPGAQLTSVAQIPGVFFQYDLVPIVARVREQRPYASFIHLLLTLCSICGGIFTVAGLVDAIVYHGAENIKRKINLGKQS